ncbi:hypothetical protein QBC35DRAFT_500674 [Podospora australis]|uniref:FeS cluster biogenesis domain-containing protein n=1 Tax=Podospora australis TaxID=1536484 RepID=A0AAN7AI75_9PEZI|nr:hypothetical protein QBC35DRAFT_500674 [Podospora australis]
MPPLHCANAPMPANLFIQLSMRRQALANVPRILDLLLPIPVRRSVPVAIRAHHAASYSSRGLFASRPLWCPQNRQPSARPTSRTASPASWKRAFTTTPSREATRTLFNPQNDDDGNPMVLEITPRAGKRLSEIMTKDANPYLALRIQVESGGCHGFQYLMKLVTLPPSLPADSASAVESTTTGHSSSSVGEDDTIFSFVPDDSSATPDLKAPKIILDGPSLELLKGSKVDFTMELIGSQFKIVDNPLATSSCGCGTSFDIKI